MHEDKLDRILKEVVYEEINKIEGLGDIHIPEFNAHMEKLKMRAQHEDLALKQGIGLRSKRMMIIAALIAYILICPFLLSIVNEIPLVEAWRVQFLNTMIEMRDTHTEINFNGKGNRLDMPQLVINYIPSGFECTRNNDDSARHIFRVYENGDKHFSISISPASGNISFDTEGAIVSDVDINGKKGILSDMSQTTKKTIILIFYDDTYCYDVIGNISKEEILKVAENINLR